MISTVCKLCCFKEMHGDVQTGCSIGKLTKFYESGAEISNYIEDGKSYKQINRVCQFLRESWNYEDDIHKDTFIRVNIVVHDSGNKDDLINTIKSIEAIHSSKEKRVIIVTENSLSETFKLISDFIDNRFVTVVRNFEVMNSFDLLGFKNCKNGWVFFVNSGYVFKQDCVLCLNHAINFDLKKIGFLSEPTCYFATIYKYLLQHPDQTNELESITGNWEEIYDNYRAYLGK